MKITILFADEHTESYDAVAFKYEAGILDITLEECGVSVIFELIKSFEIKIKEDENTSSGSNCTD